MMSQLPNTAKTPPFLQLINWIVDPLSSLEKYVKIYGDIFTLKLGILRPWVLISHPQGIKEIFAADSKQLDTENLVRDLLRPLLGDNSLFVLDGDRHKRERKLLMPPFHGERLKSYAQLICQVTKTVMGQLNPDMPFDARTVMEDITLEVILNAVFGLSKGERYEKLKLLLLEELDLTNSPLGASLIFFKFLQKDWGNWSPWGRIVRRKKHIYDLLQEEINERRSKPELRGIDILSLMMSARDENGEPMKDIELKDELMTLLSAGQETTATALVWTFYWIHKLPDVRGKLLQEIDSLDDNFDPINILDSPYLNAVCQETLRIYPVLPISIPRITKSPLEIMGHKFETGTTLAPCIYLLHHREDLYPEPKQFRPERFLERKYTSYEYIPFGGGTRHCIGDALAQMEIKLVLATALSQYELSLADDKPVKPQHRALTISPGGGVKLVMTAKHNTVSDA